MITIRRRTTALVCLVCWLPCALAVETNASAPALTAPGLTDAGVSLLRVAGALVMVLGLFLGGVWLYRNWQRLGLQRCAGPKLRIVEVRPLGGRHALYVVGYEQERFLLAASPNGVSLLTPLPAAAAPEEAGGNAAMPEQPSFARALSLVLGRK